MREKFIEQRFSRYLIRGERMNGSVDVEDINGIIAEGITRESAERLISERDKIVDTVIKLAETLNSVNSEMFDKIWYGG